MTVSDTRLAGRYLLVSEIGRGPKAIVYKALDETLDRAVAVKILRPAAAGDAKRRSAFLSAAAAAAQLSHPNIVRIFDTGEYEEIPFVVMELMAGESLSRMFEQGLLDPGHAAIVGEAVASALVHSHGEGIAHGNLEPSNVLFSARGLTKVSDFEKPGASAEDRLADIGALGRLLYQGLTGRPPGEPRGGRVLRPSDLRPEIPRELDLVITRAITSSDERSFREAAAMARAFAEMASDEEVPAAPGMPGPAASPTGPRPSFVRTEGRWLLRTALVIALAAMVTVAALKLGRHSPIAGLFGGDQPQTLTISSVSTYDPPPAGNGEENSKLAANTIDGDTGTAWHTEWYRTANLGGAKPGVGLVFDLESSRNLQSIEVDSVEGGWTGSLRDSDDGTLWSDPSPSIEFARDQKIQIQGAHRYWMIWITRLIKTPNQGRPSLPYSIGISEIRAFGK